MIGFIKALLGIDNRPEWVKEKDRKLIAAIKEAGDNLYVGPHGGVHRNPESIINSPKFQEASKRLSKLVHCDHSGKTLESTDEVLVDGKWEPSTTYRKCKDCSKVLEVLTNSSAFMSEDVPRRKGEWKEL